MCENQGGLSKGYSTTDNLFILHMFVNIMKCKKKKLFCVFIEFAATFDTVWRDGLWNKLLINQINGKMYNIICDMYSRIKSRVVYNCNKLNSLLVMLESVKMNIYPRFYFHFI